MNADRVIVITAATLLIGAFILAARGEMLAAAVSAFAGAYGVLGGVYAAMLYYERRRR